MNSNLYALQVKTVKTELNPLGYNGDQTIVEIIRRKINVIRLFAIIKLYNHPDTRKGQDIYQKGSVQALISSKS